MKRITRKGETIFEKNVKAVVKEAERNGIPDKVRMDRS